MNADSFDRLSRHMGAATTRRGLLRAFVAGVSAAVAGSHLRAPAAQARVACDSDYQCGPAQRCESGVCVADSDPARLSGNPEPGVLCGLPGGRCCSGHPRCMPAIPLFCNSEGTCQVCLIECGGKCCAPLETCVNGTCVACGLPGQPCCAGDHPCTISHFCNPQGICQFCFPPQACGKTCCAPEETCINNVCTSKCGQIGQPCCADNVCDADSFCNSSGTCQFCVQGYKCGKTCCGPFETCSNGVCS